MDSTLDATVTPVAESDHPNGEFELILTNDALDRDGEHLWVDDWEEMPGKIHMDSDHAFAKGMSVPFTVGSGKPEITENGDIVVRGTYAGTEHGQLTRQLVKEGHIWQASVAFQMNDNGKRELLNGTFTGVPSNVEAVVTSSKSADKKPYGDVSYADPGYLADKQARYPVDTADHVRAALSYFGQSENRGEYSAKQQSAILGRIRSAARRFGIDVSAGAEKALIIALCKSVQLHAKDMADDDNDEATEPDDDPDDVSIDDMFQAIHDAAVALGHAVCPGCDGTGEKNVTNVLPNGVAATADVTTAAPGVATVKSATAVTPNDLAARAARLRKFQYGQTIQEMEVRNDG